MINYLFRFQYMALLLGVMLSLGIAKQASALTWHTPPENFTTSTTFTTFSLAADPSGNAFTVWIENNQVLVSRFSAITGSYGASEVLYTGNPYSLTVATDATGKAIVVWFDGVSGVLLSSYFNGASWTPILPAVATVPIFPFQVTFSLAMDGLGNGLLNWQDQSVVPFPGVVFASFFDGTTQTWNSPQSIDLPPTGGPPQNAFSSNGTAIATWSGPPSVVFVSNFDGTNWSLVPTTLSSNGGGSLAGIDSAGNALVVWIDGATGNATFSHFTGGVWSVPQFISTTGGNHGLSLAMSPTGAAVATWIDGSSILQYSIFNGTTWSTPLPVATDVFQAKVAIDTTGDILVVWTNSASEVLSSFRAVNGSFGPQVLISSGGGNFVSSLLTKLSDNKRGFADWLSNGPGTESVDGSFTLLAPSPPQSISGTACSDKFVTQVDRIHIISWTPSLDPSVVSYYLKRNGVLIANLSTRDPLIYLDHNRCKTDVYTVVAVDASGNQSLPLEVTIR